MDNNNKRINLDKFANSEEDIKRLFENFNENHKLSNHPVRMSGNLFDLLDDSEIDLDNLKSIFKKVTGNDE